MDDTFRRVAAVLSGANAVPRLQIQNPLTVRCDNHIGGMDGPRTLVVEAERRRLSRV